MCSGSFHSPPFSSLFDYRNMGNKVQDGVRDRKVRSAREGRTVHQETEVPVTSGEAGNSQEK